MDGKLFFRIYIEILTINYYHQPKTLYVTVVDF